MPKTKVLLDTDIGSDIDDCACLAYLLMQPQCELLGITTVSGEPVKRAMMASALCTAAGKNIPIYPGCEQPILGKQRQTAAQQATKLSNWNHSKDFAVGEHIEFMRRTIRENPGEVTLLCIGPLTNVALLFRVDQEIPSLLKGLVMMHGEFTNSIRGSKPGDPLEWNALLDPYASAVVYTTQIASHRSIGIDVTHQVRISKEEAAEKFHHPLLKVVFDFAGVWFDQQSWFGTNKPPEESQYITFHDPVAGASIFNSEICTYTKGLVEVELTSEKLRGMTFFSESASDARHQVALSVNHEAFYKEYFSVFR